MSALVITNGLLGGLLVITYFIYLELRALRRDLHSDHD